MSPSDALVTTLRARLPQALWPVVLPALHHDPRIWQTVEQIVPEVLSGAPIDQVETWSPAGLALFLLGSPVPLASLKSSLASPLPAGIARQAAEAYRRFCSPPAPTEIDLPTAGLLALALRERRRITGHWDGLTADLAPPLTRWQLPLTCLLGMTPDSRALFAALATGAGDALPEVLLHAILCQPLPPQEQVALFQQALQPLSIPQQQHLLGQLEQIRPPLAQALARQWPTPLPEGAEGLALAALVHRLQEREDQARQLLGQAWDATRRQEAELLAQLATAAAHHGDLTTALTAWEQATQLAPDRPLYLVRRVQTLLQAGDVEQAARLIPTDRLEQPWFAVAWAELAAFRNDLDALRQAIAAAHALPVEEVPTDLLLRLAEHAALISDYPACAQFAAAITRRDPQQPLAWRLLSHARFKSGDVDGAIEAAQFGIALSPERLDLRRQLADLLESRHRWSAALSEWQHLAERQAQDPEVWAGLARCALQAGRPDTALQAARQWLHLQPDHASAHLLAGQALLQAGQAEAAAQHLRQATALRPDDPQVWLAAARARQQAQDQNGAIETLRAAAVAVPYSPEVHLTLGEAYLQSGQPSQALSALQLADQLLSRLPQPAISLTQRLALAQTQALTALGRLADARQLLEPVYRAAPEHPALATTFAHLALIDGHPQQALQALKAVIHHPETPPTALLDYARAALACDIDPQAVIAVLDRLLQTEAPPAEAWYWKAEALQRAGRPTDAIPCYRQALEHTPPHPADRHAAILHGLGTALLATGDPKAARSWLERAAETAPRADTCRQLAETCRQLHDPTAAIEWGRRACQAAPNDLELLCWYADLAQQLEQPQEAAQALQQATRLAPHRPDLWLQLAACSPAHRETACRQVLALEQVTPDELHTVARHLLSLQEPQLARQAIQRALEQQETPALLRTLAEIQLQLDDPQAALQALERARELAPQDADLALWQADLLTAHGDLEAAHRCLEDALPHHPQPEVLHRRLMALCEQQGDLEGALHHAARLPAEPHLVLKRAEMHYTLLQDAPALTLLQQHPPAGSADDFPALCLAAEIHLNAEAEIAAAEALTQARHVHPDHPRVLALLSRVLLRQGDREQAHNTLAACDPAGSDDPFTQLGCALAARELEAWDLALSWLQSLCDRFPTWPRTHFELARTLTERAEARLLAQELEVHRHAPPPESLSPSAARAFDKAILQAGRLARVADHENEQHPVLAWYSRGQALWHPTLEHAQALARFSDQPTFMAAYLAALRRAGRLEQAVEMATTILARLGDRLAQAPVLLLLQLALTLRHDRPEQALQLAQRAAGHPLATAREQAALALIARQNRQPEQARHAWQQALLQWPDEPHWHQHLARLYLEQRPPDRAALQQAAFHLEQAVVWGARGLTTRLLLAQTHLQIGQPEQALSELQDLQAQAPEHSGVWLTLARAHFACGQLEQADACAEQVLQHHPQPSEAQAARLLQARIALQSGRPAQAVALARQAQAATPTPEGQLLLAQGLAALGQPEAALQALDAVFDPQSAPFEVALERARLLQRLHGADQAIPAWQALARRFPDRLEAMLALARALAAAGQVSPAIQSARRALELTTDHTAPTTVAAIHRLLGELHHREGQHDLALSHLSKALKLQPEDFEAYLLLADVYESRREPALAADVLQQALALQPDNAALHFRLGSLLQSLGDLDAAEHLFRQAAQLDPHNLTYRHQWAAVLSTRTLQRTLSPEE